MFFGTVNTIKNDTEIDFLLSLETSLKFFLFKQFTSFLLFLRLFGFFKMIEYKKIKTKSYKIVKNVKNTLTH